MKLWKKYVVMLSIIAGAVLVLFSGGQEHFMAWGQADEPGVNLLTITHGGQDDTIPDGEDVDPGAFTAGSPTGDPNTPYDFQSMKLDINIPSDVPECEEGPYPVNLELPEGVRLLDKNGEETDKREFAEDTTVLVKATQPSQNLGDIVITATCPNCEAIKDDVVKATAVVGVNKVIATVGERSAVTSHEDSEIAELIVCYTEDEDGNSTTILELSAELEFDEPLIPGSQLEWTVNKPSEAPSLPPAVQGRTSFTYTATVPGTYTFTAEYKYGEEGISMDKGISVRVIVIKVNSITARYQDDDNGLLEQTTPFGANEPARLFVPIMHEVDAGGNENSTDARITISADIEPIALPEDFVIWQILEQPARSTALTDEQAESRILGYDANVPGKYVFKAVCRDGEHTSCDEGGLCIEVIAFQARITDAAICNNRISITLEPGNVPELAMGTLTLELLRPDNTVHQVRQEPRAPGNYNESFDIPNIPSERVHGAGMGEFTIIQARWRVNNNVTCKGTRNYHFRNLGEYRHSQYNTPDESDPGCAGNPINVCITNAACNYNQGNLSDIFASQADLNGSGISINYGIVRPEAWCQNNNPPPAVCVPPPPQVGYIFRGNTGAIMGTCGPVGADTVAVGDSNPDGLSCGNRICIVQNLAGGVVKTVTDRCPACDDPGGVEGRRQLDNYNPNLGSCLGLVDLGNYNTIQLYAN